MVNIIRTIYRLTAYRLLGPFIDAIILFNISYTVSAIFTYLTETRKLKAMPSIRKGFEDHRIDVGLIDNPEYTAIFKRIGDAYNKAKAEQKNIPEPYRVGILWQRNLDDYCADLITALHGEDVMQLQTLLQNFHREKFSGGLQGAVDYFHMKEKPLHKYLFLNTWYKFYSMYQDVAGSRSKLTYPMVGNPVGLYHDGQVIPLDAIRFHASAIGALSLLEGISKPVICEIGGGFGGQAHTILSSSGSSITYILLDIPEVLAVASYFLMASLPEKRFLLYGEGPLYPEKFEQYDIILMPNFVLPKLGDETVDLFLNQASFSEMNSSTSQEYLSQIERICRRYFMHINHNKLFVWNEAGKEITNIPSTQLIPSPSRFKKMYQYPWLYTRPVEEIYYKGPESYFAFLYVRRSTVL